MGIYFLIYFLNGRDRYFNQISQQGNDRERISYILKEYTAAIKAFSSDFNTLYAWGSAPNHGTYLKDDLSDFESVVFNQLRDDEIAYSNPNKTDKDFTLDSKCFIGYSNSYSTNKDYKQNQITVTIGAGKEGAGDNDPGILNFTFSESLQPDLDLLYLTRLLEFSIHLVDPYYATVSSFEFSKKVNQKKDKIQTGWITYVSNKKAATILPGNIAEKKILSNGGVILWLSKDKVLSTDKKAVQKAIKIRNILADNE